MSRISHDDMYNLHETADDIPGYIHKIITFPDLVCVIPAMFLIHERKFYARLIALVYVNVIRFTRPKCMRHTVIPEINAWFKKMRMG